MDNKSAILNFGLIALIGGAIFFIGQAIYRSITGVVGGVVEAVGKGADWVVKETEDYVNTKVAEAEKAVEVIGQGAAVVGQSTYDYYENQATEAAKGLEVIKKASADTWEYINNLW